MSSRRLQDVSSRRLQDMSSRCLEDMSSRRLEEVFRVTIFRLPRRLQDVLRNVFKTFSRRLQDVFKTNKCLLGRLYKLFYEAMLRIIIFMARKTIWSLPLTSMICSNQLATEDQIEKRVS